MTQPRSSPRLLLISPNNAKRAPLPEGETRSDLLIFLVGDTGIEPVTSSVSRNDHASLTLADIGADLGGSVRRRPPTSG